MKRKTITQLENEKGEPEYTIEDLACKFKYEQKKAKKGKYTGLKLTPEQIVAEAEKRKRS